MIKKIIKKSPCLYNISIKIMGYFYKKKIVHAYRKYGKEAIQLFAKCMDDNNIPYSLAFGSILGAIREHGFIKHDLDIDTFIWIDDFSNDIIKRLQEVGFKWSRSISVDGDKYGREDTFVYKGVNIDIFYLYPAIDKYPYCCDFLPITKDGEKRRLPRRIEIPVSRKTKIVPFEGIKVKIPANAEEICEFRYGPSYMTPNPNWHWKSAYNATTEWPEMIGCTLVRFF